MVPGFQVGMSSTGFTSSPETAVLDLARRFVGHQFRAGGLWKNSVPLVEVRRPSDGGNGDFLPVVTQFGGVRLRTGYDV